MIRIRELKMPLEHSGEMIITEAAKRLGIGIDEIKQVKLVKKSVDARKKNDIHFSLTVDLRLDDEAGALRALGNLAQKVEEYTYPEPVRREFKLPPVVVGSGPAGLFAALTLAKAGARPLMLERGQNLDERTKIVERFWTSGELDSECNAQFGEGGAGTFSDGKLTSGIKDKRIGLVFEQLLDCGAPEEILYLNKPHIGTDLLRETVKNLREKIEALGGRVIFGARFCDFEEINSEIRTLTYEKDGQHHEVQTKHIILAVGHSARDVFELLYEKGIALRQKPFSVGLRIEHLQSEIDRALYGRFAGHPALGAADYKLAVHLPSRKSVYSFCMCPGGRVVAAATEPGGLVTNGMSVFKRDGENANSALLVPVLPEEFGSEHPLAGVEYQRRLERMAYLAGGGGFAAPVTTVGAFFRSEMPAGLGAVKPSYQPGVTHCRPEKYLPESVCGALRAGITEFGRKIKGFDSPDAVLTGVESRSSSPLRIVRDECCVSVSVRGLYPCGEGAGYAGGIVSAAVDGIRCAEMVMQSE